MTPNYSNLKLFPQLVSKKKFQSIQILIQMSPQICKYFLPLNFFQLMLTIKCRPNFISKLANSPYLPNQFFSCSSSSFTINPSSIPRLKPSHTITSPEEFYRYPIFSFFIFHFSFISG